jgi:hypothetical protein
MIHQRLDKAWGWREVENALEDLDERALERFYESHGPDAYGDDPDERAVALVSDHVRELRRAGDATRHAEGTRLPADKARATARRPVVRSIPRRAS